MTMRTIRARSRVQVQQPNPKPQIPPRPSRPLVCLGRFTGHHYRFGLQGTPDVYRGVCVRCGAEQRVLPMDAEDRGDWKVIERRMKRRMR